MAAVLVAGAVIGLLAVAAGPVRAHASPCHSATVVPAGQPGLQADCEALWGFYTGLDDVGALHDPGPGRWGSGSALSSWRGVTISPVSGRVIALDLYGQDLAGAVSPGLGRLTELVNLGLGDNALSGSIPAELGELTDLAVLNLSRNALSGSIPPELGQLANLVQLSLYENDLTGPIPPELGRLSNLADFEYYGNRFEGPWPSELSRFNPYLSDPLGLISNLETHRRHSLGAETWDVWFCETPAGDVALDSDAIPTLFNARLTPYFGWLSDGRYRPRFRHVGTVTGADMFQCAQKADDKSADGGSGNRRLVVSDEDSGLGVFEGSSVMVAANAASLAQTGPAEPDLQTQWLSIVAHEMGHALGFLHSFGGNVLESVDFVHQGETLVPQGSVSEYDNPMDIMSNLGYLGATIAVNRYAAGWIDPADVAVHPGGAARTYDLGAPGLDGAQMLVLPSGDFGVFFAMGARIAASYDSAIPSEGVEVYRVTHRVRHWQNQPFPPAARGSSRPDWTQHVYSAGDSFEAGAATVEILSRSGDGFTVRVTGGASTPATSTPAFAGRFSDDDSSVHEANIEIIAARGITVGCSPTRPDRFCPNRPVTRAQMMAFLDRALGPSSGADSDRGAASDNGAGTGNGAVAAQASPSPSRFSDVPAGTWYRPVSAQAPVGVSLRFSDVPADAWYRPVSAQAPVGVSLRFSDVPADAWYRPHLERLAALGVVEPYEDGTFRPSEPLIRRDMAVFLARAFPGISPAAEPAGVFADVPAAAPAAAEVEGVLAAGVTRGCSTKPMRYCPDRSVTRAQMASFLARALRSDRPAPQSSPTGSS